MNNRTVDEAEVNNLMQKNTGRAKDDLKSDLAPRTVPSQERANETVQLIVDTAAELLEEVGADGFNTNLIAKRAGINIATIYRYFPNKKAILNAFSQKWKKQTESFMVSIEDLADPTRDWRELLDLSVNNYIAMTREQPGYMALRRMMQADPELREIENRTNQYLAEKVCETLNQCGLSLPEKHAMVLSHALIMSTVAIYDFAWKEDREDVEGLLEETKLLWKNHLATYLN